jgi:hypothetical protein
MDNDKLWPRTELRSNQINVCNASDGQSVQDRNGAQQTSGIAQIPKCRSNTSPALKTSGRRLFKG